MNPIQKFQMSPWLDVLECLHLKISTCTCTVQGIEIHADFGIVLHSFQNLFICLKLTSTLLHVGQLPSIYPWIILVV